ncbi:MAG TPA: hypothetical protein ENG63_07125 [Candidatus Desulfofervidus auxilii]|uniref:Uncharacterized protein n=1 Tax=Desulfofervidus auxilii TaxID=1621989 RepID=A0A7C0U3F9_DESA2|nr:hypothetical protein [Candidatus Desulfofervidus auxilii]
MSMLHNTTAGNYKHNIKKVCNDLCQRFGYTGNIHFIAEHCNKSILEGTADCLCYLDDKLQIAISINYTVNGLVLLELRDFKYAN